MKLLNYSLKNTEIIWLEFKNSICMLLQKYNQGKIKKKKNLRKTENKELEKNKPGRGPKQSRGQTSHV